MCHVEPSIEGNSKPNRPDAFTKDIKGHQILDADRDYPPEYTQIFAWRDEACW